MQQDQGSSGQQEQQAAASQARLRVPPVRPSNRSGRVAGARACGTRRAPTAAAAAPTADTAQQRSAGRRGQNRIVSLGVSKKRCKQPRRNDRSSPAESSRSEQARRGLDAIQLAGRSSIRASIRCVIGCCGAELRFEYRQGLGEQLPPVRIMRHPTPRPASPRASANSQL